MRTKLATAGAVVTALVLVLAGAASATPTVVDQVTTMATDGFGDAVPIVIAVATAAIGLAAALFGVRKVLGAIKSGGRV